MQSLKRFFWVVLIFAAFGYGFVYGSEKIAMSDVANLIENGWNTLQNYDFDALSSWTHQLRDWVEAFYQMVYGFICNFSKIVI